MQIAGWVIFLPCEYYAFIQQLLGITCINIADAGVVHDFAIRKFPANCITCKLVRKSEKLEKAGHTKARNIKSAKLEGGNIRELRRWKSGHTKARNIKAEKLKG